MINKNKTTIIGHSMGAMLGSRISLHLREIGTDEIMAKELVALDTAELLATGYKFKITQDGEPFSGFKNTSQNTKCFVGTSSAFGNENISEKCNQTYKIDFPLKVFEHSGVHEIYRQILKRNTLYNNILSPKNIKYIPSGKIQTEEIDNSLKLSYLKTETENKSTFYGSEVDNEFKCTNSITKILSDFHVKENQKCEFAGWKGDDSYEVDRKTNYFEVKDFINNEILWI